MSGPGSDAAGRRARAVHQDEETRYRAVAELDAGDALDRAVLVYRLADPSWRVRAAAVERMTAAPGAVPVGDLVRILDEGPGAGAREAAAAVLVGLGAPAVPLLVERLAARDPDLRQAAAGVLGAIADGRAVVPLAATLADPDASVRAAAAAALGRIDGAAAIGALRSALDSADPMLRVAAVEALGAAHACLPAVRIERLLVDRPLRRALYRMLGDSDDAGALAIVARGLADPSRATRAAALGALGRQRARRTAAELAPALAEVRATAAREPGLVEAWAVALGSEAPFVAAGALAALAAAGAARHAGRMVKLAEDERHRALVEETLEHLPEGAELRAALADSLPALGRLARITALAALARLGSPAALESVVREASDRESYVQAEAIAALGRLRDARAVPPLAGLLDDDDASTGALAATALARIGQSGPAARQAVLVAVRDRTEASRSPVAAYRVLGALGGAEDVSFVVRGLEASEAAQRAAAAGAARALAERGLLGRGRVPAGLDVARAPGPRGWRPDGDVPRLLEDDFKLLRDVVHAHSGMYFREESRYLLERRLAPRLDALGLRTFAEYHRFLRLDPGRGAEIDEALEVLTTNETYFYRDPLQLGAFAREILPELARARTGERRLRIVSAGCSTGEEVYTVAVLVKGSRLFDGWDVEIVGYDISRRCIAHARTGAYGEHAFRTPEAEPMRPWLHLRGGKWCVDDAIRRLVRFGRENLLDPGALARVSRVDVLFCRNVMIYFDASARKRVLRRFHEKLRDGGWLLLGHSESLLNLTADFEMVHLRSDLVYRKPHRAAAEESAG